MVDRVIWNVAWWDGGVDGTIARLELELVRKWTKFNWFCKGNLSVTMFGRWL